MHENLHPSYLPIAYLYGSVAKDIVSPFSDLDVAIYVEGLDRKESLDLELSLSLNLDALLNHIIESEVQLSTICL